MSLRVSGDRLVGRLQKLATFTDEGEGITRLAWSRTYLAAQRWLMGEMNQVGLAVSVDAHGNTWGRWGTGRGPGLVVGSHIDSVPNGGRYDGCLGVMAGLEAIQTLVEAGVQPVRPVWLVAWAEEEGSASGTGLMGSRSYIGALPQTELEHTLKDGRTLGEVLHDIRAGAQSRNAPRLGEFDTYLELHIEQGPVLDGVGVPVGVVTEIVNLESRWIKVEGEANHAGGTPMELRHDALAAATELISWVEKAAPRYNVRATVGSVAVEPNATNVIPGGCSLTVDVRGPVAAELPGFLEGLNDAANSVAAARGVRITQERMYSAPGAQMASGLQELIADVADSLSLKHIPLTSWAGHDAMVMAQVVRSAMVFVPCSRGISHAPAEYAAPGDCASGASVLAAAIKRLAS